MTKMSETAKLLTKEMLEQIEMPRVTFEQAKLILVYQALRDSCGHRKKARESLNIPDRTFKHYVSALIKAGLVKDKSNKSKSSHV